MIDGTLFDIEGKLDREDDLSAAMAGFDLPVGFPGLIQRQHFADMDVDFPFVV